MSEKNWQEKLKQTSLNVFEQLKQWWARLWPQLQRGLQKFKELDQRVREATSKEPKVQGSAGGSATSHQSNPAYVKRKLWPEGIKMISPNHVDKLERDHDEIVYTFKGISRKVMGRTRTILVNILTLAFVLLGIVMGGYLSFVNGSFWPLLVMSLIGALVGAIFIRLALQKNIKVIIKPESIQIGNMLYERAYCGRLIVQQSHGEFIRLYLGYGWGEHLPYLVLRKHSTQYVSWFHQMLDRVPTHQQNPHDLEWGNRVQIYG